MPSPSEAITAVTECRRSTAALILPHAGRLLEMSQGGSCSAGDVEPATGATTCDVPPLDMLAASDPHDAFFRVARQSDGGHRTYLCGVATARRIVDDESQADTELGHAADVLRQALDALAQPGRPTAIDTRLPEDRPTTARSLERSVRRWVRGHQVFAVITQGLALQIQAFDAACTAGCDDDALGFHLRRVGELYITTAWAMRFTADFPRHHYEDAIRLAMSEPHAPAGFSGALSADHAVLIQRMVRARASFDQAGQRLPAELAATRAALRVMYDDHKHVCARLAGLDNPSIRSAGLTHEQHASGVLLDRFRDRRAQLLR